MPCRIRSNASCTVNVLNDLAGLFVLFLTERMPARKLHRPRIFGLRAAACRRTLDPAPLRGHWGPGEGVNRRPEPKFRNHKMKHLAGHLQKKTFVGVR